jgi:anti-anti-sigma factor
LSGRILVGSHQGVYLILFEGDVRLTLCSAVDGYIDNMFRDSGFKSVVVDLSATDGIDSTSLGILAKLSIQAEKLHGFKPTLVSTRRDITRILLSMGFDDVFTIVEQPLEHEHQLGELTRVETTEEEMRLRVLDAHRTLMGLNDANREAFHDLVDSLQSDDPPIQSTPRRVAI